MGMSTDVYCFLYFPAFYRLLSLLEDKPTHPLQELRTIMPPRNSPALRPSHRPSLPPSLPPDEELGPLPIVFVGDLNGSPKGQVAEYLRHKGFVSAFEAYNRPRAPHKVPPSLPPPSLPPSLPPNFLPAAPQYIVFKLCLPFKPVPVRISNQT